MLVTFISWRELFVRADIDLDDLSVNELIEGIIITPLLAKTQVVNTGQNL